MIFRNFLYPCLSYVYMAFVAYKLSVVRILLVPWQQKRLKMRHK